MKQSAVDAKLRQLLGKAGGKNKQKGSRKIGRMKKSPSHQRYVAENRQARNKARKLRKHLKNQPHDEQARAALARI